MFFLISVSFCLRCNCAVCKSAPMHNMSLVSGWGGLIVGVSTFGQSIIERPILATGFAVVLVVGLIATCKAAAAARVAARLRPAKRRIV